MGECNSRTRGSQNRSVGNESGAENTYHAGPRRHQNSPLQG